MNHAAHLLAEMNAANAIRKAQTHEQALVLLATLLEADTLDDQEQEVASDAISGIFHLKDFTAQNLDTITRLLSTMARKMSYRVFSRGPYGLMNAVSVPVADRILTRIAEEAHFTEEQKQDLRLCLFHAHW